MGYRYSTCTPLPLPGEIQPPTGAFDPAGSEGYPIYSHNAESNVVRKQLENNIGYYAVSFDGETGSVPNYMHAYDGNPDGNLVDKVAVEVSYDGVQKAGASEVASKQHVEPVFQQSSQPASDGYGKDIVDKYANDKNAVNNADGKEPAPAPVMLEADAGAKEGITR